MTNDWKKYFITSYDDINEVSRPKTEAIYFGGVCLLVALGFVFHFRCAQVDTDNLNILFSTRPSLHQKLEVLEAENSILESEFLNYKHKFSKLLDKKANEFVIKYNSLLAIKETSGEGVIVRLNDSVKPLTFGENPNLMIVHNLDLLSVVNELWGSGATAISVNDQRITTTSEFNCIGPIILINNSRIMPPFKIKAIGNANKLYNKIFGGYIKKYDLEKYGITFSVTKKEMIKIPASSNTQFLTLEGKL